MPSTSPAYTLPDEKKLGTVEERTGNKLTKRGTEI